MKTKLLLRILWLLLGTVLMYFSNWNWAVPATTWLFSVFLLRFTRAGRIKTGLPILFIATVAVGVLSMWRLLAIDAIPPSFRVTSGVAVGVIFFLPFLLDRLFSQKINGFVTTLIFPCSWTAIEFLKSFGKGSWGALAYTQYGNLPFMQLTSVTGIWGMAFLITWFASIVNYSWERKFSWSKIRIPVFAYGLIVLSVFLYGSSRLIYSEKPTEKLCVSSVVNKRDFFSRFYETDWTDRKNAYRETQEDLEYLLTETRSLARSGAKVVFWQEYAMSVLAENKEEFIENIKGIAREEHIYLGAAIGLFPTNYPDKPWQNKLFWVSPDGQIIDEYTKLKPAPPLEPIVPGEGGISIINTPYGKIASIICADLDYPSLVREASEKDAEILLIPAQDWTAVDPLHSEMAVFRAIENGLAVVKGSGGGSSIAVDSYGRIVNSVDRFNIKQKQLISCLPTERVATLYMRLGDSFAWLCVFGLIVFTIWSFLVVKKQP